MSDSSASDLTEIGDDRLAVRIRGRNSRIVPIRACWTNTARPAVRPVKEQANPCPRFHHPERPKRSRTSSQPRQHRGHRFVPETRPSDLADRSPHRRYSPAGAALGRLDTPAGRGSR